MSPIRRNVKKRIWQSNCEASKRGKKCEGHSRLDKDKPWQIWWEQYISIPALNGRPGKAILAKLSLQLAAYGGKAGAGDSQTHVLSHFLSHLSKSLLSGSKTFIKTQKDVHFTNHFTVSASFFKISHTKCHWCWKTLCFFLNQNCLTDETWPPEATVAGTRHSPTPAGSGILLASTDPSNFSWLRRDPREKILTHLLTEAKKSSAEQGCRAWRRTLVSTPGPWPPDHSTSPSFLLIKVRKGLQSHIPFIYSVHPLACLSLA